ncbi:MAG: hypothetical protein KDD82_10465 [Planctomycetes bacterium]|nr:hypothetical protein [Planctomycetota bacterium]
MTIRIGSATQGATCVYCHDALGKVGVSCPCGARYHEDCAAVFGACAIPGCGRPLAADLERWALPRLGTLAQLLRVDLEVNPALAGSSAVVCLHTPPRAVANDPRAAQAVANVLGPGHAAFDARLRLNTDFPEPLVRTASRLAADQVVGELQRAGLVAQAVGLADLLKPLETRDPREVELLPTQLSCVGADGERWAHYLDEPYLVMGASVFHVSRKHDRRYSTGHQGDRGGGARSTRSLHSHEVYSRDPAVFVYSSRDPVPSLLQRERLRTIHVPGSAGNRAENWLTLVKRLERGAAHNVTIRGANSPALRAPSRPGYPSDKSNLLGLLLVGRLHWLQWTQGGARGLKQG